MQWADTSSCELLDMLIKDRENSNLMVILCSRSDEEISDTHSFTTFIEDLGKPGREEDSIYEIRNLEVKNLSFEDVNRFIQELLSDDDSRVQALSEICHRRTHGNPFLLTQFLSVLYSLGLLAYNLSSSKWKWDLSEIESRVSATSNVVELVRNQMGSLPKPFVRLLQIAACLGSTFDERTLLLVWDELKVDDEQHVELDRLVEKGIFEVAGTGTGRYRWLHDKLQEGALELIDEKQLSELKSRVGRVLVSKLGAKELGEAIFVVCNLLNQGSAPSDAKARVQLAEYNLRAAERAVDLSAFESAFSYAEAGIKALPDGHMHEYQELSVGLYSTSAEATGYTGCIEHMEKRCKEVIQLENCPLRNKMRVYHVLLDHIHHKGKPEEAIELCLDVLGKLGGVERMPDYLCGIRRSGRSTRSRVG